MLNGFMVCSFDIGRKLTVCGTVPRVGAEEDIASGNGDEESERKTLQQVLAPLLGIMKALILEKCLMKRTAACSATHV